MSNARLLRVRSHARTRKSREIGVRKAAGSKET